MPIMRFVGMMWSYLKSKVDVSRLCNLKQLQQIIYTEVEQINPDIFKRNVKRIIYDRNIQAILYKNFLCKVTILYIFNKL